MRQETARLPFFTIGHSTRSVDEFADLLHEVGADMIVDVRKMPRSRANPQFNGDFLSDALACAPGAERPTRRRSAGLAARAARQALAQQRPGQGHGLHAQALERVQPVSRRRAHLPDHGWY